MPRRRAGWQPKLRRHVRGCGVVRLDGKDHYFKGDWPEGKDGPPPDIQQQYDQLIARWLANGRRLPAAEPGSPVAVRELVEQYRSHLQELHQKKTEAGKPAGSLRAHWAALGRLQQRFGDMPVASFDRVAFRAYRKHLEDWRSTSGKRLGLSTVNGYAGIIKTLFRWGFEERSFVPAAVLLELQAVKQLTSDKSSAPVYPPRKNPPPEDVQKVLAVARPKLRAMMQVQMLTGMRPHEVCLLKVDDIDRSRQPWVWVRFLHKTMHRTGKPRRIYFGPRARSVLAPWLLRRRSGEHVFVTRNGQPVKVDDYRKAVRLACARAGVPRFTPHQLRHHAATVAQEAFDTETSSAFIGDSVAVTAKVYAHALDKKAQRAAEAIG